MADDLVVARKDRIYSSVRKRFVLIVAAAMTLASPGFAAGIDSRAYTCAGLQALVAARGFVFVGNPDFQDFIVSNGYYCSGNERTEPRSVVTSDNPQCPVQYCGNRPTVEGQT